MIETPATTHRRKQARALSAKTGRNHVDALAGLFAYAQELGLIESNPVPTFRSMLRRRSRTQRGRVAADLTRHVRPVERVDDLNALAAAARTEGAEPYAFALLCLDAGLRLGEATGLRWGAIAWGADDGDARRALRIEESRPRGGAVGPTKSGRARTVALSRRLRAALEALYRERSRPVVLPLRDAASDAPATEERPPRPDEHVLAGLDPSNYSKHEWKAVLYRARIGHVRPKDLRDSYASHLLTAAVQLGYISRQLGHADVGVTARHYARWCGDDSCREPLRLEPGEVPADFLARLVESPQTNPTLLVREDSPDYAEARKGAVGISISRDADGGAPGNRTPNQRVKSPMLCQLS